jgi:hypothetical protein
MDVSQEQASDGEVKDDKGKQKHIDFKEKVDELRDL